MTIIVFLIDNSASMNQRTVQGTTLLDIAKTATELFFKIRMGKSRVDRYFILTLDAECNYIKLAGWKQNVDLQVLHLALNSIKPDGCVSLGEGLQRTFRMLNLNRLQLGLENYGMEVSVSSIETAVLGQNLTTEPFRWDYRLYSLILRYPAFMENVILSNHSPDIVESPIAITADLTGGRAFVVSDHRELHQCLESLAPQCHPAVVVDFNQDTDAQPDTIEKGSLYSQKQLIYVKVIGRVCSTWPIPESYWPDDEILSSQLPSRTAHPKVYISAVQAPEPNIPEYFPLDRYELEPSHLTKSLCAKDPNLVWPCYCIDANRGRGAPFAYLKATGDLQTVHMHVLPYNYPCFSKLLSELYEVHHMRMSESWGLQFVNYLSKIPRYYLMPLTKAFERFGFPSVIKPEAIDRVLPYQLKHSLQKLRHAAKIEYENFIRITQNEERLAPVVRLPAPLLPVSLWSLREIRPKAEKPVLRSSALPYCRASDIRRSDIRRVLKKMRHTLSDVLNGIGLGSRFEFAHQQPVAQMGDYINYRGPRSETPLREVNPTPERLDTFGNPFRKKNSTCFVADEVFVDEMGISPGDTMVLVVEGEKRLNGAADVNSTAGWLLSLSSIEQSSSMFHGQTKLISNESDLLYIHQGEMATLRVDQIDLASGRKRSRLPSCVASDDATSCLLIVVHSRITCAIAHMDTTTRVLSFFNQLRAFFDKADDQSPTDVFLVGSVNDASKPDRRVLLTTIAQMLRDPRRDYVIRLYCVEKLNTVWRVCPLGPRQGMLINYPISTGLVYNWRTREVASCKVCWSARGPVSVLRLARLRAWGASESTVPVFDTSKCSVVVKPFGQCAHLCDPEALTEEVMRSYSTTPDQEPRTYFEGCRAVASLIAHHPDGSFWFPEGRPLLFSPSDLDDTEPRDSYWIPTDTASNFAHTHPLTAVTSKSDKY
ncbi:Integrator complex subunit 6 [Fasciola gigantica]|uniref:Integrator complex subunit 6 n=1 Tax=Fasciola gigantica TaxID=46835 RepID=A0A504ZAK5_FASGI|nr:Integrator complex subunit 6 [Fasciola gigantica]